ncbi:hypothetical protein [Burkholderia alba]|uniref:hypothetical protein n=1 Tax=Burkholderia alba TaxID=2683677 RepID=UPI002B0523B8|nr:hypothetical protein [Burkholderia alba]
MDSQHIRFFWLGDESEIFVAESIYDLATEAGRQAGSNIASLLADRKTGARLPLLFDADDRLILWGEIPGTMRQTIVETDDDDYPIGTFTGSLFDIYECDNGGRYGLPWMLMTQYA